jgi:hypothetical protein
MKEALDNYPRWRAAEADDRDDDADEAFRSVFQAAAGEQPVSLDFTAETMKAIAAATAVDARRARQARAAALTGVVAATAGAAYFGAGWAIGLVSATFLGLLNLLVAAVVRTAEAFQTGAGFWGVLSSLGQATAAVAADSSVTFAMIAISVVAIAALAALQRLLGSDEESFQ